MFIESLKKKIYFIQIIRVEIFQKPAYGICVMPQSLINKFTKNSFFILYFAPVNKLKKRHLFD